MRGVEHKGDERPTILGLVLQLHGEFQRSFEPICVTPLQTGVLLYLRRHADAKLADAAAALRVTLPTLSTVVKDLVRKRWALSVVRSWMVVSWFCHSVGGGRRSHGGSGTTFEA
jgi:hypothetical protein